MAASASLPASASGQSSTANTSVPFPAIADNVYSPAASEDVEMSDAPAFAHDHHEARAWLQQLHGDMELLGFDEEKKRFFMARVAA
ncbi:hypothetical protein FN846DRAFT_905639 [Sphaerosporella brunnea]|uniref:Uncharacterized protein n=1 Tax=Sphaerosporella brunnea TaxID=1250544 RepID=A0A5J5F1D5_9PEZI|nr:hypothetical protein FN846DRAFT_905639 [Sphaerosporella brunnea]